MFAPVGIQYPLYLDSTIERCVRGLKGDKEAITRVVNLFALKFSKLRTQSAIVPAHQVAPGLVTHGLNQRGGAHDVGEHERTNDTLRIAFPSLLSLRQPI